jgi:hypothetical protein
MLDGTNRGKLAVPGFAYVALTASWFENSKVPGSNYYITASLFGPSYWSPLLGGLPIQTLFSCLLVVLRKPC